MERNDKLKKIIEETENILKTHNELRPPFCRCFACVLNVQKKNNAMTELQGRLEMRNEIRDFLQEEGYNLKQFDNKF